MKIEILKCNNEDQRAVALDVGRDIEEESEAEVELYLVFYSMHYDTSEEFG